MKRTLEDNSPLGDKGKCKEDRIIEIEKNLVVELEDRDRKNTVPRTKGGPTTPQKRKKTAQPQNLESVKFIDTTELPKVSYLNGIEGKK